MTTNTKELNLIKTSKGFNFGPAVGGCTYWKGVLLHNVLLDAGVRNPLVSRDETEQENANAPRWGDFERSNELIHR
ncbi:Nitrate reductase [NADH] [Metarhizium anisopliae]|nr:Nitrate reductase [NADH] [Metarhizium anisopliae]